MLEMPNSSWDMGILRWAAFHNAERESPFRGEAYALGAEFGRKSKRESRGEGSE